MTKTNDKRQEKKEKDPVVKATLKLLIKFVSIFLAIGLVFTFIFGLYRVNDTSMVPAINPGDMILYYRLDKDLVVGETVVYNYRGETTLARVVAMPGDEVTVDESGLVVNGSHQYEPKIYKETLPMVDGIDYPVKLKEDEVFLLADNRDKSIDSRLFGPVKISQIQGKIFTLLRRREI